MTQLNTNTTGPVVPDSILETVAKTIKGLSAEQKLFVEGYIRGLREATAGLSTASSADLLESKELVVLFGSESGNSEALADATAKAARKRGFTSRVIDMADTQPKDLVGLRNLLVIVSTWGEGDPPETAESFYHALMGASAPRLPELHYSVLALGDTSYEQFCATGKAIDSRLEALGAARIYPRVDCDVDYDALFQSWSNESLDSFDRLLASKSSVIEVLGEQAEPVVAEPVVYNRKNPFAAELSEKVLLNGRGSNKETMHLEFSLKGSGITYAPGDSLAVVPQNCELVVGAILKASKLDPDSPVNLKDEQCTLREALTSRLDVTTLSAPVLKRYSELAENSKLENLLKPDNKFLLNEYISGRDLADLISEFPAKQINPDALVALTRKLPPRLYSIASSQKAHPDAVNLTVAVVRYDAHGRERKGVCSTFLADRLAKGQKAEVFVTPNKHFKLPENPETPIIMVGPGTGIAPFRAFIEERAAIGANGRSWLFFGDQHFLTDFLYQLEWKEYLADGKLTRMDLAFSRDQPKKVYVQDRMRERSRDLYAWLEEGAVFYVCGDATKMAVDVDKALHDCVAREAGLDADGAAEYVAGLKKQKRYLRDVY
jgi:sulfite reductase (NADPH) flavoprotein alpha-component